MGLKIFGRAEDYKGVSWEQAKMKFGVPLAQGKIMLNLLAKAEKGNVK